MEGLRAAGGWIFRRQTTIDESDGDLWETLGGINSMGWDGKKSFFFFFSRSEGWELAL